MSKITEVYSSLCLFTVTRGVLKTPVIKAFIDYCEEEEKQEKLKKYGVLKIDYSELSPENLKSGWYKSRKSFLD